MSAQAARKAIGCPAACEVHFEKRSKWELRYNAAKLTRRAGRTVRSRRERAPLRCAARAPARSSQGDAPSRSKISRASARDAVVSRQLGVLEQCHAEPERDARARGTARRRRRSPPRHAAMPGAEALACASRNGGRDPGGTASMSASSSCVFAASPSANAASSASTTPCFTPWRSAPRVGPTSIVAAPSASASAKSSFCPPQRGPRSQVARFAPGRR